MGDVNLRLKIGTDGAPKTIAELKKIGEAALLLGDGVEKSRVQTQKSVETIRKDLNGIQNLFSQISAGVGMGLGIAGLQLTAATLASITGKIKQTTLEFEKFRTVLTTTYGDANQADAAFGVIQKFAATTPFQLNEVLNSFIKLKNRGLEPTEGNLRNLGDIASSQGKSFDQLTEAVLDAMTGENERLKEFGIKASQAGSKVSFTFKDIVKTVDRTPEAITKAILSFGEVKGVAGGMEAQSKTLGGQLSNLEDNFQQLYFTLGNELLPVFTSFVGEINNNLPVMQQFAREAGQNIAAGLTFLGQAFKVVKDNAEILQIALNVLLVRFVALRVAGGIALTQELLKTAVTFTAMQGAAFASQAALVGFTTALRAATLAAATAAAPLLAITAIGVGAYYAAQTRGMYQFNDGIDAIQNGADAATGATLLLTRGTKKLNEAYEQNGKLTKEQEAKAKEYVRLNYEQIKSIDDQIQAAKDLKPANEEQRNAQQATIASLEKSKDTITKETQALEQNLVAIKKKREGLENMKAKLDEVNEAAEERNRKLATEDAKAQKKIIDDQIAGVETLKEAEKQKLAANQQKIDKEIDSERQKLNTLLSLDKAKNQAEEKEKQKAIQGSQQKLAQLELQGSQARLQIKQKNEEDALDKIVKANQDAENKIKLAQDQRTAQVKQRQLAALKQQGADSVKVEAETQKEIAAIQADALAKELQARKDQLAKVQAALKNGQIDPTKGKEEEKRLIREIAQLNTQRIDAEIAQIKTARDAEVRKLQEVADAHKRNNEDRLTQLEREGEIALANADQELRVLESQRKEIDLQRKAIENINALTESRINLQRAVNGLQLAGAEGELSAIKQAQEARQFLDQNANISAEARARLEGLIAQQTGIAGANQQQIQEAIFAKENQIAALKREQFLRDQQAAIARAKQENEQRNLNQQTQEIEARRDVLTARRLVLESQIAQQKAVQLAQSREQEALDALKIARAQGDRKGIIDAERNLNKAKQEGQDDVSNAGRALANAQQQVTEAEKNQAIVEKNRAAIAEINENSLKTLQTQQEADRVAFNTAESGRQFAQALARARTEAEAIKKAQEGTSFSGGGGRSIEARRTGGSVLAGGDYLVGEEGPELFTPRRSGVIIPAAKTAQILQGGGRPVTLAGAGGRDDKALIKEVKGLREDLKSLKPSSPTFNLVGEEDPLGKALEINQKLLRYRYPN